MKLIDRHIAGQYFEVLLLATIMIGGIFLGTAEYQNVLNWICNIGMDWHKACLVSALQLPSIAIFALPAGTLIATILVLYRLNCDGELLAMRMAGVSHLRLMMPFFALSITAATVSFCLSEFVSPRALSAATQLLHIATVYCKLPVTKTAIAIKEPARDGSGEMIETRLMMMGHSLNSALKNVVVLDLAGNSVSTIHWAESGMWHRGQWQLLGGRTYTMSDGESDSGGGASTSSFSQMVIDTAASKVRAIENDGPIPEHKTLGQLKDLIADFRNQNKQVPPDVMIDFYHRYSQPLACLLLVVAAFPIAVGNHRRGHSSGMIYGGIMTTTYFLIQEITQAMGYDGRMEPFLAVWLPSLSLTMLGLVCLTFKLSWQRD